MIYKINVGKTEHAMEEAISRCAEEHGNEYIVKQECLEKLDEVVSIRRRRAR